VEAKWWEFFEISGVEGTKRRNMMNICIKKGARFADS
jgi:hypothetical protein